MPVSVGRPTTGGGSSGTFNFVTRADIPATNFGGQNTIMLQGFSTIADGGERAMYKKVGAGGGPMALQDSSGTWYELILNGQVNIKWFGARGDGSTNDTAAIDLAIASMPGFTIPGGVTAKSRLYMPAGTYMTNGGHVIPNSPTTTKFSIEGDGMYQTFIRARSGASGDMLTAQCQQFSMQDLAFQGTWLGTGSDADGLVLDGAFAQINRVLLQYIKGSGLVVGKGAKSSGNHICDVQMRYIQGHGLWFTNNFANFDSYVTNLDVGITGGAGIRDQIGANNYVIPHPWSCGIESDSTSSRGASAGIWIQGGNTIIIGAQPETNHGPGIYVDAAGAGTEIGLGNIWGNRLGGIHIRNTTRVLISGVVIRRNGIDNAGAASNSGLYAGVVLEGSTNDVTISGCTMTDDTATISATSYQYTPTYPFGGKTGEVRQTYGAFELGTASGAPYSNTINGCSMKRENHTTAAMGYQPNGGSVTPGSLGSVNTRCSGGNNYGTQTPPSIAAASSITVRSGMGITTVTGSGNITFIAGTYPGDRQRLVSNGTWTLVNGSNLKLTGGNFVTTPDSSIELSFDGSNWYEVGRVA